MSDDNMPTDQLVTVPELCRLEGIRKTSAYHRLGRGEYGTIYRDGPHKLLVSMRAVLERRKRVLRQTTFTGRGARRVLQGKEAVA